LGERRSGVVTQVDGRGGQRASGRAGWCGYSFGEQVDGVRAISRVGGGELWAEALRPVAGGDVDDGQLSRDAMSARPIPRWIPDNAASLMVAMAVTSG
jgi:hypothetical protein